MRRLSRIIRGIAPTAFSATAALLFAVTSTFSADFEVVSVGDTGNHNIVVSGRLEAGDEKKFSAALQVANKKGIAVRTAELQSPGGAVSAGIEIGRLVRKNRMHASAPINLNGAYACIENLTTPPTFYPQDPNCICASACALIWFGGVSRGGEVGVHRSFLPQSGGKKSFDEMEQVLDRSHSAIADFLNEMRIPTSISELVLATSSSDLVLLHPYDFPELAEDRLYSEYLTAECGEGLSKNDKNTLEQLAVAKIVQGKKLSTSQESAYRLLNQVRETRERCTRSVHIRVTREAQLAR